MKVKYFDISSQSLTEKEINAAIFSSEVREDIIHRVVRWQLAKRRSGAHKTKGRSEVSGTTRKPWKQKGTGNARLGSMRAAQCRTGGIIFGPVVRSHEFGLPKRVRALGLRMAITSRLKSEKLVVLKDAILKSCKTKEVVKAFSQFSGSILIIDGGAVDSNFLKASSNIHNINILPTIGANVYDIIKHEHLFITEAGLKSLEERLA